MSKAKLPEGIKYGVDYCCPACGEDHSDTGSYEVEGVEYPQYYNERRYFNGWDTMYDWEEVHKCVKCGTLFYFSNGAV